MTPRHQQGEGRASAPTSPSPTFLHQLWRFERKAEAGIANAEQIIEEASKAKEAARDADARRVAKASLKAARRVRRQIRILTTAARTMRALYDD